MVVEAVEAGAVAARSRRRRSGLEGVATAAARWAAAAPVGCRCRRLLISGIGRTAGHGEGAVGEGTGARIVISAVCLFLVLFGGGGETNRTGVELSTFPRKHCLFE